MVLKNGDYILMAGVTHRVTNDLPDFDKDVRVENVWGEVNYYNTRQQPIFANEDQIRVFKRDFRPKKRGCGC